jgi:hypothetical protein
LASADPLDARPFKPAPATFRRNWKRQSKRRVLLLSAALSFSVWSLE